MKRLINALMSMAAISFIITILSRLFGGNEVFGFQLHTLWRFTSGCLLFAISLILIQIRDKR